MPCRNILLISALLFLSNCTNGSLNQNTKNINSTHTYLNKGFALVYSKNLYDQKTVSKKISDRSLTIFQKNLKINTQVKITNILNNKT